MNAHSTSSAPLCLNLGAGRRRKPGYLSVDLYCPEADMQVDLEQFPWPWADGSVDAVYMSHVLEHMTDVPRVAREVHRILKPGGTWEVSVPHAGGLAAHLTSHRHRITLAYMHDIGCDDLVYYTNVRYFRTVAARLTFCPGLHYGRWSFAVFPLLERLANLSGGVQTLWEFLHWPTESIYWRGVKPEQPESVTEPKPDPTN
ncbi:MAG: class I SAM-dependent methyltransferase [Kiritimatiellae bacterium]|nr:class I SAM-dependent methyltransferase [Kiritimatiellia bacterium]